MVPSVATLLAELYPNRSARECLPTLTITYMAPGGHRQWPMSITALLDRLSWLVLQTRPLAMSSFQAAVQRNPWRTRYRNGPKITVAPSTPFKFLDIGTKMSCNKIGDHIPGRHDTGDIFHPLFAGDGIPPVNTFRAVIHDRAAKQTLMVKCIRAHPGRCAPIKSQFLAEISSNGEGGDAGCSGRTHAG